MVENMQPLASGSGSEVEVEEEVEEVEIPAADKGLVVVNSDRCKGCGLCPAFCPPEVLEITDAINVQGYHPVRYLGSDCTGCAICYYICPEPGALTVYRREGKR